MIGQLLYKNWREIKPLSESTWLAVNDKDQLGVIRIYRYPEKQQDVFELLMAGQDLKEADEEYLAQAHEAAHRLETMARLSNESPQFQPCEFTIEKQKGASGWQICAVKPLLMPLEQYAHFHQFDLAKTENLLQQLLNGVITLSRTGFAHGHITAANVLCRGDNDFILDDGLNAKAEPAALKLDVEAICSLCEGLACHHPDYAGSRLERILTGSYEDPWQLQEALKN